METFAFILRYSFVLVLAVEAVFLGRAMFGLLSSKARAAIPVPAPVEE